MVGVLAARFVFSAIVLHDEALLPIGNMGPVGRYTVGLTSLSEVIGFVGRDIIVRGDGFRDRLSAAVCGGSRLM